MQEFAGRHALITGGASGIGLAIAQALEAHGALVTVTDYDRERLEALPPALNRVHLDVRDREAWRDVKYLSEAALGPVSILCNNAGIGPSLTELADCETADFDRMIAIKLVGTFNGIHAFAGDMRERRDGHIVNTASMAGLETSAKLGAYTASKFGVVGLSEVLRTELEPFGVGVSVLCPGMVSTGLPVSTAKADGHYDPHAAPMAMPGIRPDRVAQRVLEGIRRNWPYILTHGERKAAVASRMRAILDAFDATPVSSEL